MFVEAGLFAGCIGGFCILTGFLDIIKGYFLEDTDDHFQVYQCKEGLIGLSGFGRDGK